MYTYNMTSIAQQIGKMGELLAARYLLSRGYRILDKNYMIHGVGEIDIIAETEGELHFVEVKTSSVHNIGDEMHPAKNVTREKCDKMARVMRIFSQKHKLSLPRSISILFIYISRETHIANVYFEKHIYIDTL